MDLSIKNIAFILEDEFIISFGSNIKMNITPIIKALAINEEKDSDKKGFVLKNFIFERNYIQFVSGRSVF